MKRLSLFISLICLLGYHMVNAQHFPEYIVSKKGHNVVCLDINKQGDYFITGGDDAKVVAWDLNKGTEYLVYSGNEDQITAVKFKNDDGNIFAAGDKSGMLTINDVFTGSTLQKIKAHEGQITSIDFNLKYDVIATSGQDGKVNFWDFKTGQHEKVINADEEVVNCVKFSPDNETFLTAGADGKLRIWDYSSGAIFQNIDAHKSWIRDADFSTDQKWIATGADDKKVKIWSTDTWQEVRAFKAHKNWVTICQFAPDQNYLLTGGFDSRATIWNFKTKTKREEYKTDGKYVSGMAISPDLSRLVVAGYHENIEVWNVSKVGMQLPDQTPLAAQHDKSINPDYFQNLTIELIQPAIARGQTFKCLDEEFTVKGQVSEPKSIRELLVNGDPTPVNADGYFQKTIKVGYLENKVSIRALTFNNQYVESDFVLYRIFDQQNPEALADMSRAGKDYALIIATNDYTEMPNLINPLFDAKTIADELSNSYNFEVELVTNPSKTEILSSIRNYGKKMYGDEDQLFIFIAGHGEFDNVFNDGYIVAKDSRKEDEIKSTYISHSSLRTIVNSIPCKHIFLTMDVCFGGTFDPYTARSRGFGEYTSVDKEQYIKRKMKYKTRLYLTSGGKEYVPDGRPNYHSPFARRFIAALRSYGGEDGILTYTEMMSFVEKTTPEPRTGEFGDNEPGSDFLFIADQ